MLPSPNKKVTNGYSPKRKFVVNAVFELTVAKESKYFAQGWKMFLFALFSGLEF
jgi:hypothetical protein